jgi:ABC-type multidrug transport system fused ATPase/permease subunit
MVANVKKSLLLLDPRERTLIVVLTACRALLGLLDIAGIFLIGLLLAKATNQITSNNYNNETLDFVSEISGNLDLIQIALLALVLFVSKSIFASLLMKYMTVRFAKSESKIATQVYLRILNSPISKSSKISKSEITYALTYSAGFAITQTLTVMVIIFSELFLLIVISAAFALVDLQLTLYIVLYF